MAIYTRERKYKQKINEIVVKGNMYTKMNFLCTKLRKVSTKGKKKQVIISEVVVVNLKVVATCALTCAGTALTVL